MRLYLHRCVYVYINIYMYVCMYTCVYTHTHIFVQIFLKDMGIFALIHVAEWGVSFRNPVSLSPRPTSPLLRHPLLPSASPTQGWLFWSGVVGKVALWHSFQHSLDWMYCSLLALFVLWSLSCPERRNKGLEFTECLFLKSLYAFPTFFFLREKKASGVFFVLFFVFWVCFLFFVSFGGG